ncbi:MAG: DeoR/GlpR family DNA-binding transcription regulator [Hyphomicrobium sp.]|nr:DeoR/GlpR family DNA-binding transcription regulator [Hyphomicrobium sp.]
MKPRRRQAQIAELVSQQGQASVEALAALYGVSAETIRRDLSELSGAGLVEKFHGGARRSRLLVENSFLDRVHENSEAKVEIAKKVEDLIQDGETIFIDTGSTTLACAQRLVRKSGLTVVTNSARIAQTLAIGESQSRVYLLGGMFRADNAQTVGPIAIEQIRKFRADRAILTVTALDTTSGASDADIEEAHVARAMLECANQLVILADSTKMEKRAAFNVCRLEDIDTLVTDRRPPPFFKMLLDRADIEVF